MSSIKCTQCGLVNFSTMTHCKRCGQTLNGFAAVAEQNPFQTNIQNVEAFRTQPLYQNQPAPPPVYQNRQAPYQSYQNQTVPFQPAPFQPQFNPPPPPQFQGGYGYQEQAFQQPQMPMLCVKCGDRQSVYMQNFKKDYVPSVAYLALLMGLLPGAIIIAILSVKHQINAPFCLNCWDKFRKVGTIETLSTLGFFVGIIVGIIGAIALNSGFVFLFFFALTVAVIVWGQVYKHKHSPKYKKVDSKQVVIDAPAVGEMCFVRN
jgi:hypothetical protein